MDIKDKECLDCGTPVFGMNKLCEECREARKTRKLGHSKMKYYNHKLKEPESKLPEWMTTRGKISNGTGNSNTGA